MEDVVQIIKPDPDSQYRLVPCDCGSAEVVYAKYYRHRGGLLILSPPYWWRVVCTACGKTVDPRTDVRHDVQLAWNRRNNHGEIDRKTRR